jgi:release factor glutamine methyltransferase
MPLSFREWLSVASHQLQLAHIENPHREARLLLQLATGRQPAHIVAFDETPLTEVEMNQAQILLERRCRREPMAHLAGMKGFFGRDFFVSPQTLIPRPETERLVELVLQALEKTPQQKWNLLDLGTGTGCIALTLALEFSRWNSVVGVDLSEEALEVAQRNAGHLNVATFKALKADFVHEQDSLRETLAALGQDLPWVIVSNPPYLPSAALENLEPEIRLYEPRLALQSEDKGLAHLKSVIALAARVPCVILALESWSSEQAENIRGLVPADRGITQSEGPFLVWREQNG